MGRPEGGVWVKIVKAANGDDRQGSNLSLRRRRAEALRFLRDLRVPSDDHQAAGDLRMIKLRQKVGGCFGSEAGVRDFCRVRGYESAVQKRGREMRCGIEAALRSEPPLLSSLYLSSDFECSHLPVPL